MSVRLAELVERYRSPLSAVGVVVGTIIFVSTILIHQPIQSWLLLRYAGYWLATLVWWLGNVGVGHAIIRRWFPRAFTRAEDIVISSALGTLCFGLGMFVLGLAHALYMPAFFALPALLALTGLRALWRDWEVSHWPRQIARGLTQLSLMELAALGLGASSLGLLYFTTLSPEHAGYDARWYHLVLSEHYVAAHAIERFEEGWVFGGYPQLASWHYTWAFLLPWGGLFDRVELASHLEFCLFCLTLVGVSCVAQRLLPWSPRTRESPRFLWVSLFLFPGIFVYDSSLIIGSDHMTAFYGPAIALLWFRLARSFRLRDGVLLGALGAAAVLTKYLAAMLLGFPGLWLAVAALVRSFRACRWRSRLRPLTAVLLAGLTCLGLSSAHWLKNLVWYGDPFFPILYQKFTVEPMTAAFPIVFETDFKSAVQQPSGTLSGLGRSLRALFEFSFIPHDYPIFHGRRPVFGSLFTLSLLVLPFLPRARRIWGLYAATHAGVFIWFWMHHMDRFLQVLVPWMASGIAAVGVLAWRRAPLARVPMAFLVAAQVLWTSDVHFYPTHSMLQGSALSRSEDLASSHFTQRRAIHLAPFAPWALVGDQLPTEAKLLVHNSHLSLGARVERVSDFPGTQTGLSYAALGSEKAVYEKLKSLDLTHVALIPDQGRLLHSPADDLLFFGVLASSATRLPNAGYLELYELGPEAPAQSSGEVMVGYFPCEGRYEPGLYPLAALGIPDFFSPPEGFPKPNRAASTKASVNIFGRRAHYVVYDSACRRDGAKALAKRYDILARRGSKQYWVSKP